MTEPTADLRGLIEHVAKALVDAPAEVSVDQIEEERETVLELTVAEEEVGRIVGKHGRTARALRNLLSAASAKTGKTYALEILD
jgi:predicted RNA-binding protein YlqC (UPF0109 family)